MNGTWIPIGFAAKRIEEYKLYIKWAGANLAPDTEATSAVHQIKHKQNSKKQNKTAI